MTFLELAQILLLGGVLLLPAAMALGVLVHELGHAVMGWLVGARIHSVNVGTGRLLAQVVVRGTRWNLRLIPLTGFVAITLVEPPWFRTRLLLVFLAGPFVTLGLAAAALSSVSIAEFSGGRPGIQAQWLAACAGGNLTLFILSLVPHTATVDGSLQSSDGRVIARLCRLRREQVTEVTAAFLYLRRWYQLTDALEAGDLDLAVQICESLRHERPDDISSESMLALVLGLRDGPSAGVERTRGVLEREPRTPMEWREFLLANYSFFALLTRKEELLHVADEFSRDGARARPIDPGMLRTRGAVLVALGHSEEGEAMLRRANRHREPPWLRAATASWLAVAAAKRGDERAAHKWRDRANRLAGKHPAVLQIQNAFADVLGTNRRA